MVQPEKIAFNNSKFYFSTYKNRWSATTPFFLKFHWNLGRYFIIFMANEVTGLAICLSSRQTVRPSWRGSASFGGLIPSQIQRWSSDAFEEAGLRSPWRDWMWNMISIGFHFKSKFLSSLTRLTSCIIISPDKFSVPNIHYIISYVLYMAPCIMNMGINFRLSTCCYSNQDKIWYHLQASGSTLERAAKIIKNPIKVNSIKSSNSTLSIVKIMV